MIETITVQRMLQINVIAQQSAIMTAIVVKRYVLPTIAMRQF